AHIAGALGRPAWVLLPSPCDWRWLDGRDDSPWYPSVRLFRQTRRGDWNDVLARVATALGQFIQRGAPDVVSARSDAAPKPVPIDAPWPPPEDRPPFSAVAETRAGIVQYLPQDADIGESIRW